MSRTQVIDRLRALPQMVDSASPELLDAYRRALVIPPTGSPVKRLGTALRRIEAARKAQ